MADPDRRKVKQGHVINEAKAKPKPQSTAGNPGAKAQGGALNKGTRATPLKVPQSTIDSIKRMGMNKAIEKANTSGAPPAFVAGATRMYGNRVNTPAGVGKKAERPPDRANSVTGKMNANLKGTQVAAGKKPVPKKPYKKNEQAL